jgi:hypothetical protein
MNKWHGWYVASYWLLDVEPPHVLRRRIAASISEGRR